LKKRKKRKTTGSICYSRTERAFFTTRASTGICWGGWKREKKCRKLASEADEGKKASQGFLARSGLRLAKKKKVRGEVKFNRKEEKVNAPHIKGNEKIGTRSFFQFPQDPERKEGQEIAVTRQLLNAWEAKRGGKDEDIQTGRRTLPPRSLKKAAAATLKERKKGKGRHPGRRRRKTISKQTPEHAPTTRGEERGRLASGGEKTSQLQKKRPALLVS